MDKSSYTVRHDMRVAMETPFWIPIRRLIACKVPDNEGLVTTP